MRTAAESGSLRMKTVYKHYANVYAGFLQKHYPNLYLEGSWLNGGDWDAALRVLGFTPERMRLRTYWEALRSCHQDTFLTGKRRTSLSENTSSNTTLHCSPQLYAYWIFSNRTNCRRSRSSCSPHDGRRGVLRVLRDALEQHSANDLPEKLKLDDLLPR